MRDRIVLTKLELDAIISIAGDVDAPESAASITESEDEASKLHAAFESGMEKLRVMLARKESRSA